jgi:transcriptional regulator with XRE-family HTH domain
VNTKELRQIAGLRRRFDSGEARLVRIAAGLTLREAAQAANVSASAVSRYENGERMPRGAAALAYARFLDQLGRDLRK